MTRPKNRTARSPDILPGDPPDEVGAFRAWLSSIAGGLSPASDEEMREHQRREFARHARDREEHRAAFRLRQLEASGVRVRRSDYPRIATGDYQLTPALLRAREWWDASSDGSILFLLGLTGRGKTFAAATLVAQHGGRGESSRQLVRLANSRWSEHMDRYEALLNYEGLLVVDDVGTEPDAEQARSVLFEVVDKRQGAAGRTILTSNLPLESQPSRHVMGIRDRLCERTLSRLHACGAFHAVSGRDLRLHGEAPDA